MSWVSGNMTVAEAVAEVTKWAVQKAMENASPNEEVHLLIDGDVVAFERIAVEKDTDG